MILDRVSAHRILNDAVTQAGGQAAYAKRYGVTRQYIHRILCNEKKIPAKILADLNLREVWGFVRTNGPENG